MKKLVTFLENYAQWLALSAGLLFLGYMAYSYALSTDAVAVKLASGPVTPGEVDATIAKDAQDLQKKMTLPAGKDLQAKLVIPQFKDNFVLAMGGKRPGAAAVAGSFTPNLAPATPIKGPEVITQELVPRLVKPPTPINDPPPNPGQSFAAVPAALAPLDLNAPQQPQPPIQPGVAVAGFDLSWITLQWKIDLKAFAKDWDEVYAAKVITKDIRATLSTYFLWVEIEREELIGPNKWGNKVTLKPLPLTTVSQMVFPGEKGTFPSREAEAEFRLWAEKHQADLVEPPFYQVLSGDPWATKALPAKADAGGAPVAVVDNNAPFDPANPPARELTAQEKQQVYLYNKRLKDEKAKTDAAERKQKIDAAEQARRARTPAGGGTGTTGKPSRGGKGGYGGSAPLPIAAEEFGGSRGRPTGAAAGAGERPARATPNGAAGAGERPARATPNGAAEGRPVRPIPGPEGGRPIPRNLPGPDGGIPAAFQPNAVLTGAFDPTTVVTNAATGGAGASTDVIVWAHDDKAQPGKTYHYRMRYYMKNPLHDTTNLTKDPADGNKLWVVSDFSAWMQAQAPANVHFFFADKRVDPRVPGLINWVKVDVFRRVKGAWAKETFQVVPGDGIGQARVDPKGTGETVDYATGWTLVDLRQDPRGDARIIIADENGNIETRTLAGDQNESFYKELKDRMINAKPPDAAATATPAMINVVR